MHVRLLENAVYALTEVSRTDIFFSFSFSKEEIQSSREKSFGKSYETVILFQLEKMKKTKHMSWKEKFGKIAGSNAINLSLRV